MAAKISYSNRILRNPYAAQSRPRNLARQPFVLDRDLIDRSGFEHILAAASFHNQVSPSTPLKVVADFCEPDTASQIDSR